MNKSIKGIYNSPFKKCIITSCYYPMLFMIRFVEIRNIMIPDSLYTSSGLGYYVFCSNDIFNHITNGNSKGKRLGYLPINLKDVVKKDLTYCNKIILKKLLCEEKFYINKNFLNEFHLSNQYSCFNMKEMFFEHDFKNYLLSLIIEEMHSRVDKIKSHKGNVHPDLYFSSINIEFLKNSEKHLNDEISKKLLKIYHMINNMSNIENIHFNNNDLFTILVSNFIKYKKLNEN